MEISIIKKTFLSLTRKCNRVKYIAIQLLTKLYLLLSNIVHHKKRWLQIPLTMIDNKKVSVNKTSHDKIYL